MLGIGLLAQGLRAAGLSRLVPVIMLVLLMGICGRHGVDERLA